LRASRPRARRSATDLCSRFSTMVIDEPPY